MGARTLSALPSDPGSSGNTALVGDDGSGRWASVPPRCWPTHSSADQTGLDQRVRRGRSILAGVEVNRNLVPDESRTPRSRTAVCLRQLHLGPGAQPSASSSPTVDDDPHPTPDQGFHALAASTRWNTEYRSAGSRCVREADAPLEPLLTPAMVDKPPHTGVEQGFHAKNRTLLRVAEHDRVAPEPERGHYQGIRGFPLRVKSCDQGEPSILIVPCGQTRDGDQGLRALRVPRECSLTSGSGQFQSPECRLSCITRLRRCLIAPGMPDSSETLR
jgi:hypothetical protein